MAHVNRGGGGSGARMRDAGEKWVARSTSVDAGKTLAVSADSIPNASEQLLMERQHSSDTLVFVSCGTW